MSEGLGSCAVPFASCLGPAGCQDDSNDDFAMARQPVILNVYDMVSVMGCFLAVNGGTVIMYQLIIINFWFTTVIIQIAQFLVVHVSIKLLLII